MKEKTPERPVFQAAIDIETLEKFKVLAKERGQTMSGMLRVWIDGAWRRSGRK